MNHPQNGHPGAGRQLLSAASGEPDSRVLTWLEVANLYTTAEEVFVRPMTLVTSTLTVDVTLCVSALVVGYLKGGEIGSSSG